MGSYFKTRLMELKDKYPNVIGDVRGVGLMIAMEIVDEDGKPDAKMTAEVKEKALDRDVLLLTCGSDHNVVRFIAPLIITEKEIDIVIDVIDDILGGK